MLRFNDDLGDHEADDQRERNRQRPPIRIGV